MTEKTPPPVSLSGLQPKLPDQLKQPEQPKREVTLHQALNSITLSQILLADNLPLGDAIYRLAHAIQRTGQIRSGPEQNVVEKQVNKELGEHLLIVLERAVPDFKTVPVCLGYDPIRPMFVTGEAYSVPFQSEAVMLLPLDAKAPAFPATDYPNQPTPVT